MNNEQIETIRKLPTHAERVLASAIMYAEAGIRVVPLRPNTKILPEKSKHDVYSNQHSTNDVELVTNWFKKGGEFEGYNIAISCGMTDGVFVVDIDVEDKQGNKGFANWAALQAEHGYVNTANVKTPSGGAHHFFKWTEGCRPTAGKLAGAIDTRGGKANVCSSHVAAFPSTTKDGKYDWVDAEVIAETPTWIINGIAKNTGAFANVKAPVSTGRGNENVEEDDSFSERVYTLKQLKAMLACINIEDLEYTEWVAVVQIIHSQHPDAGFDIADEWCQNGSRYEKGELEKR